MIEDDFLKLNTQLLVILTKSMEVDKLPQSRDGNIFLLLSFVLYTCVRFSQK